MAAIGLKGVVIDPDVLTAVPTSTKGVTFSDADLGTLYQRKGINWQLPAPVPPAGDQVVGPVTGPNAETYFVQVASGMWYVWFDVDADPDPDVRIPLPQFLADTANDYALRQHVYATAQSMGYTGPAPAQ